MSVRFSGFLRFCLCVISCHLVNTTGSSATNSDTQKVQASTRKHLSVLLTSGFFPGHLYPITALGEELVKRGHNVTLCTTVMEGSNLLPELPESYGINFISAGFDNLTQADYEDIVKRGFENASLSHIWKFITKSQWPNIKIRSKVDEIGAEHFDIIVCDGSVSPVAVYYSKLGSRAIVLCPLYVYVDATSAGPVSASSACRSDGFCFLSRFSELILGPLLQSFQRIVFNGVRNIDKAYERVLKGEDIASYIGVRLPLLMTTAFGFEYPRTLFPLTHYVGPLMMDSFPPLEDDLAEWLSKKPNKAVIYVGMGATGFVTTDMAKLIIDGILTTDFSVVWALPMSDQALLKGIDIDKERFYISKWIPRQTLFQCPKLAMTILHCGMNSVQESLYNGLPVMCVPHAFDHFEVAGRIEHAKVGIPLYSMVDSLRQGKMFTSETISEAIKSITNTTEYSEQASRIQRMYKFSGGSKRAADLVELYAEVGYDHLVPAFAKYEWSWVQYYNVDVYCLLSFIVCFLVYCSCRILKYCCRICCSKGKKPKSE